jgi:hypothetical protein
MNFDSIRALSFCLPGHLRKGKIVYFNFSCDGTIDKLKISSINGGKLNSPSSFRLARSEFFALQLHTTELSAAAFIISSNLKAGFLIKIQLKKSGLTK